MSQSSIRRWKGLLAGAVAGIVLPCIVGLGADASIGVLEDLYGDTGNRFQGAVGLVNFEGSTGDVALPSYGLAIDDMVVEWAEQKLNPDTTDCVTASGSCAVLEVQSTNLFEGNAVVSVSAIDRTPYGTADVNDCQLDGDFTDTGYCANTVPVTAGGTFSFPEIHQCSPGTAAAECRTCSAGSANAGAPCTVSGDCFGGTCSSSVSCVASTRYRDDTDCDDSGTLDIVVKAFSAGETEGELVVLNTVGGGEYRGDLTISTLVDSPDILFLAESGGDLPTVTVRYFDADDGTGVPCANNIVPQDAGNVETLATVFIDTCDVAVVGSSITDNGDGDAFPDTNETVNLNISVVNNCGAPLNNCFARLSTNSAAVECIKTPVIPIGALADSQTPVSVAAPFVFKVGNVNRATPDDNLAAAFNVSVACDEIDAVSTPQSIALTLDLNLSDGGQASTAWTEGFEGGTLGKFQTMNLDAGIPGNSNPEGVENADGMRCQYSDPGWVNGNAYGNAASLVCFPSNNLAQSNLTYFHPDGPGGTGGNNVDQGRAFTGSFSMAYSVPAVSYVDWTTPISTIDAARTTNPINLGVGDPVLSFWHQVSLMDQRGLGTVPPRRSADRGKVQIQLAEPDDDPQGDWINLTPYQNSYDSQAVDFYYNCKFDPIDDGTTEDDFFDPTDPDRDHGPSSTCFPEFIYTCLGDTTTAAFPGPICNATVAPDDPGDTPSWGAGTWVETRIDLSEFRGRRARLRYLVTSMKTTDETWEEQFVDQPEPQDDGWFVDDVEVDDSLLNPAQIVVDTHSVKSCSISGAPCIGQCRVSQTTNCTSNAQCTVPGDACVNPCGAGQGTCTGATPACGATCTTVTAHVRVEPAALTDPASVSTPAPGQVVSFNAAAPATPSVASSCLSGALQYRFCEDAAPANGSCADPADAILRNWTNNASISIAPQQSVSITTEVRCSTAVTCKHQRTVAVSVNCPGGVNGLPLATLLATKVAGVTSLTWSGPALPVRVAHGPFRRTDHASGNPLHADVTAGCVGAACGPYGLYDSSQTLTGSSVVMTVNSVVGTGEWYLVRLQGNKNTKELAYHCNSRTYRSGGAGEVPEVYTTASDPRACPTAAGPTCNGRDSEIVP